MGERDEEETLKKEYERRGPMPHQLKCRISDSIWSAIEDEVKRTGDSVSHVVEQAITSSMGLDHHSIFQVSTTGP